MRAGAAWSPRPSCWSAFGEEQAPLVKQLTRNLSGL